MTKGKDADKFFNDQKKRCCQHLFLWSLKNLSVSFPLVIEELVSTFSFGH
jgi:hypothetical protein